MKALIIISCAILLRMVVCELISSQNNAMKDEHFLSSTGAETVISGSFQVVGGHLVNEKEASESFSVSEHKQPSVDLLKHSDFDESISEPKKGNVKESGRRIINVEEGLRGISSYIIHPDNLPSPVFRPLNKIRSEAEIISKPEPVMDPVWNNIVFPFSSSTMKAPTTYYSFASSGIRPVTNDSSLTKEDFSLKNIGNSILATVSPKLSAQIEIIAQSMIKPVSHKNQISLVAPVTYGTNLSQNITNKAGASLLGSDTKNNSLVFDGFNKKEVIDRIKEFLSKEKLYINAVQNHSMKINTEKHQDIMNINEPAINGSLQISNHTPRYEDSESSTFDDIKSFLSALTGSSEGFQSDFITDLVKNFGGLDQNSLKLIYTLFLRPLIESQLTEAKEEKPDFVVNYETSRVWQPSEKIQQGLHGEEAWRPYLRRPKSPTLFHQADKNVEVITAPTPGKFEVVLGSSFYPESNPNVVQNRAGYPGTNHHSLTAVPPSEAFGALLPGSVLIDPAQVLRKRGPVRYNEKDEEHGTFASLLSSLPFFGSSNNRDSLRMPRLPSFLSSLFGSNKKPRPRQRISKNRPRRPMKQPPHPVFKSDLESFEANVQQPQTSHINPSEYPQPSPFQGNSEKLHHFSQERDHVIHPYPAMVPASEHKDYPSYDMKTSSSDHDYYPGSSPSIMNYQFYNDDDYSNEAPTSLSPELKQLWENNYNSYYSKKDDYSTVNLVQDNDQSSSTHNSEHQHEIKQYIYPFHHTEQFENQQRDSHDFDSILRPKNIPKDRLYEKYEKDRNDYSTDDDDYITTIDGSKVPFIHHIAHNKQEGSINEGNGPKDKTDDENYYYYYDYEEEPTPTDDSTSSSSPKYILEDNNYEVSNPIIETEYYSKYKNSDIYPLYENYEYSDYNLEASNENSNIKKLPDDVYVQTPIKTIALNNNENSSELKVQSFESIRDSKYNVKNILEQIKKDSEAILYSDIGPIDVPEGTIIPKEDFIRALNELKYKNKFVRVIPTVDNVISTTRPTIEKVPAITPISMMRPNVAKNAEEESNENKFPSLTSEHNAAVAHLWNNVKLTLQTEMPPTIRTEINKAPSANYTRNIQLSVRNDRSTMAYILIGASCGLAVLSIVGIVVIVRFKKTCATQQIGSTPGRSHYNRRNSLGEIPNLDDDQEKPGHKLGSWFTGRNEQMGTGKLRSNMTLPDVKKSGSTRDLLSLSSSSSRSSSQRSIEALKSVENDDNIIKEHELKLSHIEDLSQAGSTSWLHDSFEDSLRKEQVRQSKVKQSARKDGKSKSSYHYYGDNEFNGNNKHGFESDDMDGATSRTSRYHTDSEFDETSYTDSRDLDQLLKKRNEIRSMDSEELGEELSRDLNHFQNEESQYSENNHSSHRGTNTSSFSRDNIQNEVFLEFDNMLRQHTHLSTLEVESTMKSDESISSPQSDQFNSLSPPIAPPKSNHSVAPPRPPKPSRLSPDSTSTQRTGRARAPTPTDDDAQSSDDERLI